MIRYSIHVFTQTYWLLCWIWNYFGQGFGRSTCLFCGVSTIQIYCYIYTFPVDVSSSLFWSYMDTHCWDIVPLAILSSHKHQTAYSPQVVSPTSPSWIGCGWVWGNTWSLDSQSWHFIQGMRPHHVYLTCQRLSSFPDYYYCCCCCVLLIWSEVLFNGC